MPRLVRRFAIPITIAMTVLILVPATLLASDRFRDVPDDHLFHGEIHALAEAGITRGCDSEGQRFCPGQPVSRQQMAGFLHRLRQRGVWAYPEGQPMWFTQTVDRLEIANPEGASFQCVTTPSLFQFGVGAQSITLNVNNAPDGGDDWGPWMVNAQTASTGNVDEYDICLATIDGRPLPEGSYVISRHEAIAVGIS